MARGVANITLQSLQTEYSFIRVRSFSDIRPDSYRNQDLVLSEEHKRSLPT